MCLRALPRHSNRGGKIGGNKQLGEVKLRPSGRGGKGSSNGAWQGKRGHRTEDTEDTEGLGTRHSGRRCRIGFQPVVPVTAPGIGQWTGRALPMNRPPKSGPSAKDAGSQSTLFPAQRLNPKSPPCEKILPQRLGRNPQAKFTAACFAPERHSRSQAIRKTLTS
jgi:hypothetical protein